MNYEVPQAMLDRLDNSFMYHAPFGDQASRYEIIRSIGHSFSARIAQLTPPSGNNP